MEKFIREMESEHGLQRDSVRQLLKDAHLQLEILRSNSKPAESIAWSRYRTRF